MEQTSKADEQSILDNLESSLTGLSQSLLEVGVAASEVPASEDGNADGQSSGVPRKLTASRQHRQIEAIHRDAGTVGGDRVGWGALIAYTLSHSLSHVDQGKNPNLYTKDFVEQVAGENMFMNGKLHSMKTYQDMLATALSENFSELAPEIDKRRV
ncbi:hypothetical protein E3P99_00660 [Wallemia hederae]|uniref:Mediator of RNA polymerase II transcription subunit 10 n=1 Tax=Wallemia hederae TaxID=1540922 RepID=A0A4T0FUV8_9BASI|nr:hypothetical protein E3P99_00660 [Wallemia hederae]